MYDAGQMHKACIIRELCQMRCKSERNQLFMFRLQAAPLFPDIHNFSEEDCQADQWGKSVSPSVAFSNSTPAPVADRHGRRPRLPRRLLSTRLRLLTSPPRAPHLLRDPVVVLAPHRQILAAPRDYRPLQGTTGHGPWRVRSVRRPRPGHDHPSPRCDKVNMAITRDRERASCPG